MKFRDYYRILGVAPAASADEIKTAYRKLARKLHPDVNKAADAHQKFAEINEANEALSDPAKRAAYDELRKQGFRDGDEMHAPPPPEHAYSGGGRSGGFEGFQGFRGFQNAEGEEVDAEAFSDFFQSLFGSRFAHGGQRRQRAERGEDIHYTIEISLEEAFRGGERALQLQLPDGVRTITVKIPAGVGTGSQIRLRGQGQPGSSAELSGDLYLEMKIAPHALYTVDGRDVTMELPVAPWEAVLGASVSAPTLAGNVTLTIPAGSREGRKLRLKGRGLPGDPPGDHYVVLRISVPPAANAKAQQLWKDLARESQFDPRAGLGGAA